MIEGLRGKAADKNKTITVFGLIEHLETSVEALSREHFNRPQYPISSTQGQNFPIALP